MAGGIGIFGDELAGHAVGLIFTLTLFVLDYAALEIKFFLVQHREQVAHAIALGEEGVVEHGGGDIFEIIGAVIIGGAVQIRGADTLHGVDVGVVGMWAAAE